jgi:hypothetical protein
MRMASNSGEYIARSCRRAHAGSALTVMSLLERLDHGEVPLGEVRTNLIGRCDSTI